VIAATHAPADDGLLVADDGLLVADDGLLVADDVLLVHDYLLVMRGAERTFEAMAACYPNATIATLLYDPVRTEGRFGHRHVRTSFLQPLAADQRRFRRYLPLFPLATERLVVEDARVVISSSSAFAHGVRPAADAVHICYCHSPFRYVWHERDRTQRRVPAVLRPPVGAVLSAMRRWDIRAAGRVTRFVANSELTRQRIGDFYGRDAIVVHPPVDIDRFRTDPDPEDYVLTVGEVTRHKDTEIAVAAAERAGVRIKVVGHGPDLVRLRERYRSAEFLGRVDDRRLIELYAHCRAVVAPAIEEFGITMVESHAAGRPVIAPSCGGALEIVTDGVTGVLVRPRSVDAMAEALRATDWEGFDVARLRANAERFSTRHFRERFVAAVTDALARPADAWDARTADPHRLRPARPTGIRPAAVLTTPPIIGESLARTGHRS
jgi:glycosyltransferase involved in cell wall biosynthesis